jgi:two-component system catabolic regulation response regulator CreB
VHYHGQPLPLTRYELRLLEALLRNPERVLSRAQLMAQAWQHPDHSLERTIDSHIKTLRQKLRAVHPTDPIVTHRGLGYRLSR